MARTQVFRAALFVCLAALVWACPKLKKADCTCAGCCDTDGACVTGTSASACGAAGEECHECVSGEECVDGACAPKPGAPCAAAACTGACGSLVDGCGAVVDCGGCPAGETCGAAGPNRCGVGTCTASSCQAQGKNCGNLSDGCSAVLFCGSCSGAATCGGGGVANVCSTPGCVPKGCPELGVECGPAQDGCGGALQCNACRKPYLTCGGGGVPDVCGAVCGHGCPPTYQCDAAGVCSGGTSTDFTLDVRTYRVSGSVTLNGATPVSTCPSAVGNRTEVTFIGGSKGMVVAPIPCDAGTPEFRFEATLLPGTYEVQVGNIMELLRSSNYSNLPAGVVEVLSAFVVDKDETGVVLNVTTATVSGTVTLNGAAPTGACNIGSTRAEVNFVSEEGTYVSLPVTCFGPAFPADFSGQVPLGTYRVLVRDHATDIPDFGAFEARTGFVIGAPVSNLVLDVKAHPVVGLLTRNGVAPTETCIAAELVAQVSLRDPARGYAALVPMSCAAGTTNWYYSTTVFQGDYRLFVTGTAKSNLPLLPYEAPGTLSVQAPVSNANIDVKTYAFSGVVTRNGVTPPVVCAGAYAGSVGIEPTGVAREVSWQSVVLNLPCDGGVGPFAFAGTLPGGTFAVNANLYSLEMPNQGYTFDGGLSILADRTAEVLDIPVRAVSGTITVDGQVPQGQCRQPGPANAVFRGVGGTRLTVRAPCPDAGSPLTFSGWVYPGTYNVYAGGVDGLYGLPTAELLAERDLALQTDTAGLALDVQPRPVSGRLLLNGAVPTLLCSGASTAFQVGFGEVNFAVPNYGVSVPCGTGSTDFSGYVSPGTYEVSVTLVPDRIDGGPPGREVVYERVAIP